MQFWLPHLLLNLQVRLDWLKYKNLKKKKSFSAHIYLKFLAVTFFFLSLYM